MEQINKINIEGKDVWIINGHYYYLPDVKDLRIGYSCMINITNKEVAKFWQKFVIEDNEDLRRVLEKPSNIITPYLTEEDLESKKWRLASGKDYDIPLFRKGNYTLGYNWETKMMKIATFKADADTIYNGLCPSINEFNYLSKLLKINE